MHAETEEKNGLARACGLREMKRTKKQERAGELQREIKMEKERWLKCVCGLAHRQLTCMLSLPR